MTRDGGGPAVAGLSERQVPGPRRPYLPQAVQVRIGLTHPRLIGGAVDITAMIASRLDDGASTAEMMSVIRGSAGTGWTGRSALDCCRAGWRR
jgi:hypothetical protein